MDEAASLDGMDPAMSSLLQPVLRSVIRDPAAALVRLRKMAASNDATGDADDVLLRIGVNLAISLSPQAAEPLLAGGAFEMSVGCMLKALAASRATGLLAEEHVNVWRQLGTLSNMTGPLRDRKALLESPDIQQAWLDLIERLWTDRAYLRYDAVNALEGTKRERWLSLRSFIGIAELGGELQWPQYNPAWACSYYAPLVAMHFSAATQAITSATGGTVFGAARSTSAVDCQNWERARQAAFGIGPIWYVADRGSRLMRRSFHTFCDRFAFFAPQLWTEMGELSRPSIRASPSARDEADRSGAFAVAIKSWLDASDLWGDRTFKPDFDEVRILTGVCEMLASFCYSPGDSMTQRPDPPSLKQMSPGQADFLALVRELGLDVRLVKYCRAVPVLAPRIDGQIFQGIEMGLRGASQSD